ncbi:MAG: tetratricopeptide repeat protein, partial [Bacteroides sp.]
ILWCDTANRSLCGMTKDMLPVYKGLYDKLGNEPLFLYNYAAELNVAGRYEESLRICKASSVRMSDYYTRLLLADNCKQLKRYKEAERHLQQASYMCPNRFTPFMSFTPYMKPKETRHPCTARQKPSFGNPSKWTPGSATNHRKNETIQTD